MKQIYEYYLLVAPFLGFSYWIVNYFFKKNKANVILTAVIVSYIFFSTNYENFGLSFDPYRLTHRFIGVVAILLFGFYLLKNKNYRIISTEITLYVFFGMAIVFSYIGNEININHYLHYARNYFYVGAIALLFCYMIDSLEKLNEVFVFYINSLIILSPGILLGLSSIGWHRESLFFSNPNYLAYIFLPAIAYLLFSKIKYKSIIFLIFSLSIFTTGSRSAVAALILIIFVYLIYKFNIRITLKTTLTYILISFCLFIIFTQISIKTISGTYRVLDNTINFSRIVSSLLAANMFIENPINGIGYGQFRTKFHLYMTEDIRNLNNSEFNEASLSWDPELDDKFFIDKEGRNLEKMTHNDFVSIIAETGIIGLIFLFIYFYIVLKKVKQIMIKNRAIYFMSICLILPTVFFSFFHNNMNSFMFWLILYIPIIFHRILYEKK